MIARQWRLLLVVLLPSVVLAGCTSEPSLDSTSTTASPTSSSTTSPLPPPEPPEVEVPTDPLGPIGDPYFPDLGTASLDVTDYHLALVVDPETGVIEHATATLTATALVDLPVVTLDFIGLEIVGTTIDGTESAWSRGDDKLFIVPEAPLAEGVSFVTAVTYRGTPEPFFFPDTDFRAGWMLTAETVHVVAQPDGARTWFPGNDHPADKATFTIEVTVPEPFTAVSNGELIGAHHSGTEVTWTWRMPDPMATYLATVVIGELVAVDGGSIGNVDLTDYLPVDLADEQPAPLSLVPEMIPFLESWFGPYPFTTYGHAVVPDMMLALETQTMTVMGRRAVVETVVLHEIAHQWFGNSVSVATWQDIWLSEGFATFAELLWVEHRAGEQALQREVEARASHLGPNLPPLADPGLRAMFSRSIYSGGGLALHALRQQLGDDTMRTVLHAYAERHRHGNASTADFVSIAEEVSGTDLSDWEQRWLWGSELPPP